MMFHETFRWMLVLLLFVPLLWWRWRKPRRSAVVRFSSVGDLLHARRSLAARMRWLLPALRTLALVVLIIALARPRKGNEQTRVFSEGSAIQIVVDRSGSMQAMDFRVEGRPVDRLSAVKRVVRDFVLGEGNLHGRPDDLIGLIIFGTYADNLCPLTLDHGYMIETLNKTEIAKTQEEGSTAIGDAIALGVERLRALDQQRGRQGAQKVKSRVIILLTDGESNAGDIQPLKAAEMAAAYNIKVYTIGAGTEGMAPMPVTDPFTGRQILQPMRVTIDEKTLRQISDTTGGKYFRATDTDSLRAVYAEIDKLEKTKTEEKRYLQYLELATQSIPIGPIRLPSLLLWVFVFLVAEIVLANTWLRKVP